MKRKISEEDREIYRKNALKGTEEMKGKKRGKSKYGTYSWGFKSTAKGTKPRKHKGGSILSHIFRKSGKSFVLLLKKDKKGRGKQPYSATFLESGKTQSSLDGRIKIEANSFPEAQRKAVREFKRGK